MFEKEVKQDTALWNGILTGSLTVLTAIIIMVPASYMISLGYLQNDKYMIIVSTCLIIGGFLSAAIIQKRRGGDKPIKYLITSAAALTLILVLLSIASPDGKLTIPGLLPSIISGAAGILIGATVKINKKYSRQKSRQRKYYRMQSR